MLRLRVHDPEAELLLLRHQLRVARRQVKRPQLSTADRTIMAALSQLVSRVAVGGMLVQPETVLGWHRELVRRRWAAFGRRGGPGRPGPAPLRSRQTWKAFLRAQAAAIVLTDFLSVDTVFLKRLYVLLYMELATRRVIWFAVTDRPGAEWVTQQARNVSWELNQLGVHPRFLIHDHDANYGGGSDLVFQGDGISVITTPIAAPKANSHMERQIGSTRRECLDWLLIINRRHLERVLIEWLEHYNQVRPHRGLGGLLREYSRAPVQAAA
jgi:transposase InsO family protein